MLLKDFSTRIKQPRVIGLIIMSVLIFIGVQSFASAQENPPTPEATTPSASSAQQEGENIIGTLLERDSKGNRTTISDVKISVYQAGTLIGEDISDTDGKWNIPVPSKGTYEVRIDTSTLPDGVDLIDSSKSKISINVTGGLSTRVIFGLGEKVKSGVTRTERISNLVLAGLRLGSIIAMAAVGLALIFSVTNIINFAHGELITLGALLTFFFTTSQGGPRWHLLVAVLPSIIIVGIFSASMELGIWRPLRKRETSDITLMLITIGLGLLLRHIFFIAFEGESRAFKDYSTQDTIEFLSFTTTPKTLWIIGISIFILLGMGLFLLLTKHGTALRALSDNSSLAKASGINTNTAILIAWLVGSITTALSGILLGIAQQVDWEGGWQLLLLVFAATILGGTKSVFGSMSGGLIIGVVTELSTYWIAAEFKFAVALAIMAGVLLWRPQGVLGWKARAA